MWLCATCVCHTSVRVHRRTAYRDATNCRPQKSPRAQEQRCAYQPLCEHAALDVLPVQPSVRVHISASVGGLPRSTTGPDHRSDRARVISCLRVISLPPAFSHTPHSSPFVPKRPQARERVERDEHAVEELAVGGVVSREEWRGAREELRERPHTEALGAGDAQAGRREAACTHTHIRTREA